MPTYTDVTRGVNSKSLRLICMGERKLPVKRFQGCMAEIQFTPKFTLRVTSVLDSCSKTAYNANS